MLSPVACQENDIPDPAANREEQLMFKQGPAAYFHKRLRQVSCSCLEPRTFSAGYDD
jgi:hypothetical protein